MRACLRSRGALSSEVGTLTMGSVLSWSGEAVVPHFVSDIELMVRSFGRSRLYNLPRFVVVVQR